MTQLTIIGREGYTYTIHTKRIHAWRINVIVREYKGKRRRKIIREIIEPFDTTRNNVGELSTRINKRIRMVQLTPPTDTLGASLLADFALPEHKPPLLRSIGRRLLRRNR